MKASQRSVAIAQQRNELIGRTLHDGEYQVKRLLGYGGSGRVYLASHTSLALSLALKQLPADAPLPAQVSAELDYLLQGSTLARRAGREQAHDEMPSSGGIQTDRFVHEALWLARLQHPSLPLLYDYFGESDHWYLVMDYIPGQTLGAYLRRHGPLSPLEALHYALQLCDILDYLHRQQPAVVFRDLKPANIMLLPDGTVMLVDFGSVCSAQNAQSCNTQSPSEQRDLGSPGYMAPEQYGEDGLCDPRSDLYSLGAILHEMLSGRHVRKAGETLAPLRQLRPELSHALSGLVQLATSLKPEQRFQTAQTLLLSLERAYCIEERQDYQRQALESGQPTEGDETTQHALKRLPPSSTSPSVEHREQELPLAAPPRDLALRRQVREALFHARFERVEQDRQEQQFVSVDESLQRRAVLPLSQLPLAPPAPPLEAASPVPGPPGRHWRRIIQASFMLTLILFLALISLLLYMRTQSSTILPRRTSTPSATSIAARTALPTPQLKVSLTSNWSPLPSLPLAMADNVAVYDVVQGHAYIYMTGGYHGANAITPYDHNLYRYDIEAERWEIAMSAFPAMVNNAVTVDAQGRIFFTAGYAPDSGSVPSLLYMYDPVASTLEKIVPPAGISIGFGGALMADPQGQLYISQGFEQAGNAQAQAGTGWYRYDSVHGHWYTLAPLLRGLGYAMLTEDPLGGLLLLGGATDAGLQQQQGKIYHYDMTDNSWTQEPITLPQPLSGMAGCVVMPNRLVMVGGYDRLNMGGSNSSWLIDLQTLRASQLTSLPAGAALLGTATCDGHGNLYLSRGAVNPKVPSRDFWLLRLADVVTYKK